MLTDIQRDSLIVAPSMIKPHALTSTRRLRVLHVLSHLGMGGTENGVLKIVAELGDQEFEHSLCAVRAIDAAFLERIDGRTPVHMASTSRPGFQFPLFRLLRIIRRMRPDIVHTRNFGALEAVTAARLARVPVVIHSEHGYELEILRGLPLRRRLLYRVSYAMVDAAFTVTNDLRRYHSKQSWVKPEKFQVLANGVDTERFRPRPERASVLRSTLGVPASRTVIGSVGRLVPIKSYGTLLEAAAALVRAAKDVHVLLIGKGPELGNLLRQVASTPELAGRVTLVGPTDQVPDVLNAMDIFVLPSICEGMSNTVIEAMASGLPVVVTGVGGNPEVLGADLFAGLFNPGDVHALSEILSRFVDDIKFRKSTGAVARRRAVAEFSLAGMMSRYRGLYFELAARKGIWKGS